ncbi:MAG: hypothetical protein CFE40_02720 [Burkholderiales bacterium PBB1]|nr:MAG: hypothetical protein CFE40_02720 [Burkholderiales bacterium PBB1]
MFNKSLLSIAAAAALGMGVTSANAVVFSYDGSGSAGSQVNLIGLDWSPDNALSIGALSTPPVNGSQTLQTVAQGKLATFTTASGPQSALFAQTGREYTFQASFFETATGIGTSAAAFQLASGANYFKVYADTANNSNQVTGTGYGDGTLILSGTINSLTGTFNDFTRLLPSLYPVTGLDQFANGPGGNGDVDGGVVSHVGNGSNTVNVKIDFLDPSYFLGNVAELILTLNYNDTTNLAVPFNAAQPSDSVVGFTPNYSYVNGAKVNGADCTQGGVTESGTRTRSCDFQFQSDAAGSFVNQVPEPASLALVGLALAAAGVASQRKKKSA